MLLKKGSKGEDVKKLQTKLGLTADGDFGLKTEEAVKNFQTKNALTPDGVVGDKTWNILFPPSKPVVLTEPKPVGSNLNEINLNALKGKIPDNVLSQIPDVISKFGIDTPLKLSHFLAQCAHESGNFRLTEENLNYSKDSLKRVFGKYFPTDQLAESYAKQPEKIGSRVYGGRMGNGEEPTKDGFKFRGRGYIQLTGKDNYKAFGAAINENLENQPELVATKYPLLSAAWFFKRCLPKCTGSSDADVTAVTKCVNGGTNGLDERLEFFKKYYSILS